MHDGSQFLKYKDLRTMYQYIQKISSGQVQFSCLKVERTRLSYKKKKKKYIQKKIVLHVRVNKIFN